MLLEVPAGVLHRCLTVFEVLEASLVLAGTVAQQTHEACLAMVSGDGRAFSTNFTSACGQRVFTLLLTSLGQGQWMASYEEITARRIVETQALRSAMRCFGWLPGACFPSFDRMTWWPVSAATSSPC